MNDATTRITNLEAESRRLFFWIIGGIAAIIVTAVASAYHIGKKVGSVREEDKKPRIETAR